MKTDNSHKTAKTRKQPSVPTRRLESDGLLIGRTLDYGCGKGFDADTFNLERFDPYYYPEMPNGKFETITCTYVLNVIESQAERTELLRDIQNRLTSTGVAYITVRNDLRELNGLTSVGTWQGKIVLDLPIQYKTSSYITYILT